MGERDHNNSQKIFKTVIEYTLHDVPVFVSGSARIAFESITPNADEKLSASADARANL